MAIVFKVDSLDLSQALRLNQGDGLDPHQQGQFIAPQFAENAIGEGAPLLSIQQGNREESWPVYLNPGNHGYAATKDGLHQLVRDVNRSLGAARQIEWRDEGATVSTFYDVQYARFEPAYDFRRSAQLWAPGVIKAWAKPYGHTGTMRLLATAVASGQPMSASIVASGLAGDVAADVDVRVNWAPVGAPTQYTASGPLLIGFGVQDGAGELWPLWTPAASFAADGLASTLIGASGAAGSQAHAKNLSFIPGYPNTLGTIDLGSVPTSGERWIGLMRNRAAGTVGVWAGNYYDPADGFGPTAFLPPGRQWRVVDLGVPPRGRTSRLYAQAPSTVATSMFDFAGLFRLPEDRSIAIFHQIGDANVPTDAIGAFERSFAYASAFFGRATEPTARLARGLASQVGFTTDKAEEQRGTHPGIAAGSTTALLRGFAVPDDGPQNGAVSVEVRVREKFTYAR